VIADGGTVAVGDMAGIRTAPAIEGVDATAGGAAAGTTARSEHKAVVPSKAAAQKIPAK